MLMGNYSGLFPFLLCLAILLGTAYEYGEEKLNA